jgi:hypothetical protein
MESRTRPYEAAFSKTRMEGVPGSSPGVGFAPHTGGFSPPTGRLALPSISLTPWQER